MDDKTIKAAEISEALVSKGKRALWVPVKDGIRVFEVMQKEAKLVRPRDKTPV